MIPPAAPSRDPSRGRARIVLASASPRRKELLEALGVPFEVMPADVDETPREGEAPGTMATRLAGAKARRVAGGAPEALVIAADTVVVLDGRALGKPRDAEENRSFLRALAGRPHRVVTGHCLRLGGTTETVAVATEVVLRRLTDGEIDRFVGRGAGLDKAGGYAIQDTGAALVDRLDGCYTNVVGMSLPAVVAAADRLGVGLV